MRANTLASLLALSAATPASPASASLGDFRLPADRPQQQPSDIQGPVAPDVPASRRVGPTPTPSAGRIETPAPATDAPRIEVPADLQAATSASPVTRTAAPRPTVTATEGSTGEPLSAPQAAGTPEPAVPTGGPSSSPQPAATTDAGTESEGGWSWFWLLAAVPLLLAALDLAAWGNRRRTRRPVKAVAAPQIERPRLGAVPASPLPVPLVPAEPLQISLEPLRLNLSLMNATLAYRLELANRGPAPLTGLMIGADMISAHASLSREEQLSGPRAGNGATRQRIDCLDPGESRVVEGEFRLPFGQIVPIRRGNAALLLPLARFRIEARGAGPVVRTFVVGLPGSSPDAGLQPFRLDLGPRIYPRLAQRAFA